ncbi:MAG: hypothetical protein HXL31_02415 [Prevotellaceae bacterium]|nr:hypothetical protein [Prevotellaceae bacterium]
MVQLKRKVTLRAKEAPEVSAPKVEGTAPKGPGVTPQPSSGGGKWWVAAVVVALLAAGGVYFVRQCGADRTPSVATAGQNDSVVVDSVPAAASPSGGEATASEGAGKAAPAANGNAETTAAPTGETSSAQAGGETHSAAAAPATSASTSAASAAAPTKAASTSSAPASASSTSTSAPTTPAAPAQAPTGSVEQIAREVMRGVYGNGQVRKDQLGSRYAEVQRRVNQIYRARRAR